MEQCGVFILKIERDGESESMSALSTIIDINSKPVTVRVLHVCGRMRNATDYAIDHIIKWRNSLPADFAVARRDQLNESVRQAVEILKSASD